MLHVKYRRKVELAVRRSPAEIGALAFALASALTLLPALVSSQAAPPSNPGAPAVRIREAVVDNQHGVTSSTCLLVSPNGRFHLERRHQELPAPKATLGIFESSLDSSQLQQLHSIVGHEGMSTLPEFDAQPVFFNNAPWFSSVTVEIETEVSRKVGYWLWREGDPGPEVSADVKKRWQDSEKTLRPLVEWSHQIEALKLSPSESGSKQCSADEP
jgi:hypothetical protein